MQNGWIVLYDDTMPYDPESPFAAWTRNVIDEFKELPNDEICKRLDERSNEFAVLMTHVSGDFNIGTVLRSANFHGARDFFYCGRRKFDRRGCVGVHNYTKMQYLENIQNILQLKDRYTLVGLENNIPRTISIHQFDWKLPKPPCIVVGEECNGVPEDILSMCDVLVEIPNFGSVRSMNVGVASSIAMYDYVSKKRMQ